MASQPTTSWLKLPSHSRGLDPLGAQAPAINIYGQLLPGITNVTDRARYYSFYPWMIRTYEQLPGEKSFESLREWVRRCDCLFTMIGVRHGQIDVNGNQSSHAAALTGIDTLRKPIQELDDEGVVRLGDYTVLEDGNPQRYFKTPLGGLQQYYIGPFDDLGIMKRQGRSVANTLEVGVPLAEAMDTFVDRDLFVKTVQKGEVSAEVLDSLVSFCPCRLTESKAEHSSLLELFFARNTFADDSGQQRRSTLGLLLDLVQAHEGLGADGVKFDHHLFRACVYSGAILDGREWKLPPRLEAARRQWQIYQRHELLSAASQCIFWVALRKIWESREQLWNTQEFMHWFAQQPDVRRAADLLGGPDFASSLDAARSRLPELHNWQQEEHEMQLVLQALEGCRENGPVEYSSTLEQAAKLLLIVAARDDLKKPAYAPLEFLPGFFGVYPLNLMALRQYSSGAWTTLSPAQWLAWLAGHWGVEAHLRVALRKLRFQNKETLHVLPTDQGLVVQEFPSPTYTTPRFTQGVQILEDLGAIARKGKIGSATLTPLGQSLLEEIHA